MARDKNLISLSEFEHPQIHLNPNLPVFVPTHQIGINTARIEKLMTLGRVWQLEVTGSSDRTSRIVPNFSGITSAGEGLAANSSAQEIVPEIEFQRSRLGDNSGSFIKTTVVLNNAEIVRRLSESKDPKRSETAVETWCYFLDRAIRDSLASTSTKNLTMLSNLEWKRVALVYAIFLPISMFSGIDLISNKNIYSVEPVIATYLYMHGVAKLTQMVELVGNRARAWESFKHYYSLFFGPQLDRAFLVNLLARTQPVVEFIGPKKDR